MENFLIQAHGSELAVVCVSVVLYEHRAKLEKCSYAKTEGSLKDNERVLHLSDGWEDKKSMQYRCAKVNRLKR